MAGLITVEERDGVHLIGFNDPEHLNAFSMPLLEELHSVLQKTAAEGATRYIFFGHGRSFSSGAHMPDYLETLNNIAANNAGRFHESERKIIDMVRILRRPSTFSIAAVHGWAVGMGMEIAVACDFIVGTPETKFWLPETAVGWNAGMALTTRLQRAVGAGWARRLMLLGDKVTGEEAERIGLVARLAPSEGVIDAALELMGTITGQSPLAVRYEKLLIDMLANLSEEQAMEMEIITGYWLGHTHDVREAAQAFVDKRPPAFKGC
ncbi:MAG: enoyl-CoA hydratase/isomerase family protein [Rhizobiaceae bacterium]|nr:enoyl-CoA hydratase/isomerase family protein [Rhizobiaceae bacterium]